MRKANRELHNQLQNISINEAQSLVTFVKQGADKSKNPLPSRAAFFYQLEPFLVYFAEHWFEEHPSGGNSYGHTGSQILTNVKDRKFKKLRASLFAWLSYYHPRLAQDYCEKWGLKIPFYDGDPSLSECEDEAREFFIPRAEIGKRIQANETVTKPRAIAKTQRNRGAFIKLSVLTALLAIGLMSVFFINEALNDREKKSEKVRGLLKTEEVWKSKIFDDLEVSEMDLFLEGSENEEASFFPDTELNDVEYITLEAKDPFLASGALRNGKLTSRGSEVSISETARKVVGKANNEQVFEFSINSVGEYRFNLYRQLDHDNSLISASDVEVSSYDKPIIFEFDLLATTKLGEKLKGAKVKVLIFDSRPRATTTFCTMPEWKIQNKFAKTSGHLGNGVKEHKNVDFGLDERGRITTNGVFSTYQNQEDALAKINPITLKSNGKPISVKHLNTNAYVGFLENREVFRLTVNDHTGKFDYIQREVMDQDFKNDTGRYITLDFGVDVTDYDGDKVSTFIQIDVYDENHNITEISGSRAH